MTVQGPIGVVGLGRLGRGIAAALVGSGLRVIAFDRDPAIACEAEGFVRRALVEMEAHGCCRLQEGNNGSDMLRIAEALDELAPCTFIIESVIESAAEKEKVFEALEDLAGQHVVIASNTSALPITGLQKARKHPERFVGMHWAEPAYATRFLEVIRGEQTAGWAVEAALTLGKAAGKQPCLVKSDLPGFIVNRLGYALYREAAHLLELGVGDMETIDRAFRNAVGLWATLCGPFRWIDLTGGPALYARAMTPVLPDLSNTAEVPRSFKSDPTGEGGEAAPRQSFYAYGSEEREQWEQLLHAHAWEMRRLMQRYDPIGTAGEDTQS